MRLIYAVGVDDGSLDDEHRNPVFKVQIHSLKPFVLTVDLNFKIQQTARKVRDDRLWVIEWNFTGTDIGVFLLNYESYEL